MKIEESKSECDQGLAVDRRLPRAIAHIFLASGLTANRLTLTGAIVCCFSGVMAAMNLPLAAIGSVFFVGSSFDALDGFVARAVAPTNRNGGAFLDTLADKIGESALLLGFAVRYQEPSLLRWLIAAMCFGLMTSFSKAAAAENGFWLDWPEARLWGRGIRVCLVTFGVLCTALLGADPTGITLTLIALCAFNVCTFVARLYRVALTIRLETETIRPISRLVRETAHVAPAGTASDLVR